MKINFKFKKRSRKVIDPVRDWHMMLATFFILNIIWAIVGGYMYFKTINHVPIIGATDPNSSNDGGVSRLHKIVSDFTKKQTDFETAKISNYSVSDPSL